MQLDWQVVDETKRGKYWKAEYETYDTPAGPAIATAKVEPDVYFPGYYKYETWLEDPYLEQAGARHYAKFAYGSGDEQHCMDVCEDFGVREATGCLKTFDIAKLYEDGFPKLAENYLWDNGFTVEKIFPMDKRNMRIQARVLEGGYEPALVELWLNDDLSIGLGYT